MSEYVSNKVWSMTWTSSSNDHYGPLSFPCNMPLVNFFTNWLNSVTNESYVSNCCVFIKAEPYLILDVLLYPFETYDTCKNSCLHEIFVIYFVEFCIRRIQICSQGKDTVATEPLFNWKCIQNVELVRCDKLVTVCLFWCNGYTEIQVCILS